MDGQEQQHFEELQNERREYGLKLTDMRRRSGSAAVRLGKKVGARIESGHDLGIFVIALSVAIMLDVSDLISSIVSLIPVIGVAFNVLFLFFDTILSAVLWVFLLTSGWYSRFNEQMPERVLIYIFGFAIDFAPFLGVLPINTFIIINMWWVVTRSARQAMKRKSEVDAGLRAGSPQNSGPKEEYA
ncbi:MAG: hypothetical protein A2934_04000 [Candidatus Sungbacteria bacterium RIFCSPLOWO2_01_FULL_47_10]|uniref:Uncharacterized protein n=1 Tax=Candidatus Sungbacteria bacterium RIFCSPLOWO2_01_FULL_47_10 TaxID=1802276 RepID=A0A1G2L5F7_9BACT|nr:MAG: hypothetical protein A2934_04000 [Candidatus Sungbacteria bacterium RIFCSPLOWO2_01_FULL_47_10]